MACTVWNASPFMASFSAVPKPTASLVEIISINGRRFPSTSTAGLTAKISSCKDAAKSVTGSFYRKVARAASAAYERDTQIYSRSDGSLSNYVEGYLCGVKEKKGQVPFQVQRFYLPDLHCSIPVKSHEDYDSIRASVFSWFAEWAQPRTNQEWNWLKQSDMPGLVCRILPSSPRLDRMIALGKLCLWISNIDDIGDDPNEQGADSRSFGRFRDSIVNAIEGTIPERGLLSAYLLPVSSVIRSMRADMSPRLHNRLVDGLKDFVLSSHAQVTEREKGSLPDITEYISQRRRTFAFEYIQVMMEYGLGIELDDETLELKSFKELQQAAADFIAWTNDLLSFRKEYYTGDISNLLPVVYLHRGGTDFQEAVGEVCDMIGRREADFHRILGKLMVSDVAAAGRKEELRLYLEHLPYLLSGHLEWYYRSARFHGLDHSVGETRHGYVQMQPQQTIITSL